LYANIRKCSYPFDWNIPLFPKKIIKVLDNNFDDFIPDVHNGIFHNKYDITLAHFNDDINNGIEEYKRRIDRFNIIINQRKKIYFVYINEDYLYDGNYREREFNNNIFNEMLELENFVKNKYINIDYFIVNTGKPRGSILQKEYESYLMPIVLTTAFKQRLLDNKIKEVKNNQYDMSLLDYSYWETLIKQ
jgi:hypothetical protein